MEKFVMENFGESTVDASACRVVTLAEGVSEIPEGERKFEMVEIVKCIQDLDGFDGADLMPVTQYVNQDGVVVALTLKLKPEKAQAKFGCPTEYDFRMRGKHGPAGSASITAIDRMYYTAAGEFDGAQSFAKYLDGGWIPN